MAYWAFSSSSSFLHGLPDEIVSDRDPKFTGMCSGLNLKKKKKNFYFL